MRPETDVEILIIKCLVGAKLSSEYIIFSK